MRRKCQFSVHSPSPQSIVVKRVMGGGGETLKDGEEHMGFLEMNWTECLDFQLLKIGTVSKIKLKNTTI